MSDPFPFDSRAGLKRALSDAYRSAIEAEERNDESAGPLPFGLHRQLGLLTEHVGDVAAAVNANLWAQPCHATVRRALVRLAGTCLLMVEKLDRRTIPSTPKSAA